MTEGALFESKKLINLKGLEDYLTLKRTTILRLIKSEKLPHYRVGRKYLFDLEDVNCWLDHRGVGHHDEN